MKIRNIPYHIKYMIDAMRLSYINKYIPQFERFKDPYLIEDSDITSNIIYELLMSSNPCMISRFGSTELCCLVNYSDWGHPLAWMARFFPFWALPTVGQQMRDNAGFFPISTRSLFAFSKLLQDAASQVDLLGSWLKYEERITGILNCKKCDLLCLEPYWAENPWSRALENKKVLVIHPFADTIEKQYKRRAKLFEDSRVLPTFEKLIVIKAVQSLGGIDNGFLSWFDALEYMKHQINKADFDIALIGCGAYGMPLAAYCKQIGKKAVHLGGALQLLFGIKGHRWETEKNRFDYLSLMDNPYWVRPTVEETPKTAKKVENACYW